jgi:UDP-N-acetylmuramyl pentapeptide phosphotransferase/UDP-N-acetylglucosamine-1-phosphate transferase
VINAIRAILDFFREYLPAMFAFVVGAAGWFYLFYSRAAHKLEGVEDPVLNQRRIRLRRVGGFLMLLLAVAVICGFYTFIGETESGALRNEIGFMLSWLAVLVLLFGIVVLGLIDLRLTLRLRRRRGGDGRS